MMSPPTSFMAVVVLSLGFLLQQQVLFVSSFEFDHDVDPELCEKEIVANAGVCTSNNTMWFSCPVSCADFWYGGRGTMAEERDDPEQFYELFVEKIPGSAGATYNKGVDMSLEDNEGYITMYVVLPMLPGMTEYYYNAIEHIAHVYKYTVVAMILPYFDTADEQTGSSAISMLKFIVDSRKTTDSKSILLTGYDAGEKPENKVLNYLLSRKVVGGTLNPENNAILDQDENHSLLFTRPNIFLVSHTGMFIEHIVSPTMKLIERRIKVHELNMRNNEL